jgi:hypothetical protein
LSTVTIDEAEIELWESENDVFVEKVQNHVGYSYVVLPAVSENEFVEDLEVANAKVSS